ncbi:hypothetical protein [Robiginitalea aurantiaca]|uniref:Flippase-like domain-containing protein n=1 Tax=Robiginitalea aurantiaca TaxID=3056915 RepID=A0ABT7WE03_9FLAO|nr:hypothetical protein [Robiginitalea aurantiaca]MDM9631138.1 hypothetical protein [Robiginitalea aurantiaca]
MNQGIKKYSKLIGYPITAIGFGYFVFQFTKNMPSFGGISFHHYIPIVTIGILLYLMGNLLLAENWRKLTFLTSLSKYTNVYYWSIYGRTQISKYIPGNVFHIINRHLQTYDDDTSNSDLVRSAFFEIIGLLMASSILSLFGWLFIGKAIESSAYWAILAVIIGLILLNYFGNKFEIFKPFTIVRNDQKLFYKLLKIEFLYFSFFVLIGSILVLLVGATGVMNIEVLAISLTAFSVSWIGGYITPGAPAGLGVRESILILILGFVVDDSKSIIIALIFRFITTLGDIIFFILSILAIKYTSTIAKKG